MPDTTETIDNLHALYSGLTDLANHAIPALVDEFGDNKPALAAALKLHRELQTMLKQADAMIESALINVGVEFGGEQIEGVGEVQIHIANKKVRYDNSAIVSRIGSTLAVDLTEPDPETGELLDAQQAVMRAVDEMAELVGAVTESFSNWRKGKAAAIGIDLEKYSQVKGGKKSVRIS